jgi:hypothetical protein
MSVPSVDFLEFAVEGRKCGDSLRPNIGASVPSGLMDSLPIAVVCVWARVETKSQGQNRVWSDLPGDETGSECDLLLRLITPGRLQLHLRKQGYRRLLDRQIAAPIMSAASQMTVLDMNRPVFRSRLAPNRIGLLAGGG